MAEQFVMTQKNLDDLKKELDYLVKVKRQEIIERIAEARSHGDLSENAEYDAAREEQRSNEGKIAEIEYKIKNADVREEVTDNSYVHLNSVVTVFDEDMEEEDMTLWDAMLAMYEKYGYYKDAVKSIELKGIEGLAKIQEILETLRNNTPETIGSYKVVSARDYKLDTIKDMATGEVKPTGLPASNVLYYDLNDGAWLCVRPSGTEPKVKFYYGIKGTSLEDADAKSAALGEEVLAMINKML